MIRGHNSTIIVKKKKLACGCYDYAFSKNRCKKHATVDSVQKRMDKITGEIIKEEDLGGLIDDVDALFSQVVRLMAADENGYTSCYICGIPVRWQEAQCMHYIPRGNLYLRWDLKNCKSGCVSCNQFKDGNIVEYANKLENESPGITDLLYEDGQLIYKPSRTELKQLVSEFTSKVKELKKKIH